jgi:hypothetical protein
MAMAREAGCHVSTYFTGKAMITGNAFLAGAPALAPLLTEISGIA